MEDAAPVSTIFSSWLLQNIIKTNKHLRKCPGAPEFNQVAPSSFRKKTCKHKQKHLESHMGQTKSKKSQLQLDVLRIPLLHLLQRLDDNSESIGNHGGPHGFRFLVCSTRGNLLHVYIYIYMGGKRL